MCIDQVWGLEALACFTTEGAVNVPGHTHLCIPVARLFHVSSVLLNRKSRVLAHLLVVHLLHQGRTDTVRCDMRRYACS